MPCQIPLSDIISSETPLQMVNKQCSEIPKFDSDNSQELLSSVIRCLTKVKRFNMQEGLDDWVFEITETDDEGIEFCIFMDSELDIVGFLLADDDAYSDEEVLENFGIDSVHVENYAVLLNNHALSQQLLREINLWKEDSFYHFNAFPHLQAIINRGFELAVFEGNTERMVELTFDEDEIYVGALDDLDESEVPDYHQSHEDFDPANVDESIENGIQAWNEFVEEDDDWDTDELDDEEWEDLTDDSWDDEDDLEEEWIPEFEESD